jgi:hypothetical protein
VRRWQGLAAVALAVVAVDAATKALGRTLLERASRPRRVAVLSGLVMVVAAGCASGSGADAVPPSTATFSSPSTQPTAAAGQAQDTVKVAGQTVHVAPLREAAAAICTASERAANNHRAARQMFYDRAHDRLHDLARLVQQTDRVRAARLLEAKERVERDLAVGATPERLAGDLDRLLAAVKTALTTISITPPGCRG